MKGKIDFLAMVRGRYDPLCLKFLVMYAELNPEFALSKAIRVHTDVTAGTALVFGEGKTDWKHVKGALSRLRESGHFTSLAVQFHEEGDIEGAPELLRTCKVLCRTPNEQPIICVFDRDIEKRIRDELCCDRTYKAWGNNVFSFMIPIPSHRKDTPDISIEFYYTDEEIMREDQNGRRLFLSTEFDPHSGWHLDQQADLVCHQMNRIKREQPCIIDHQVFHRVRGNVALPKDDFADNVLNRVPNFDDFDVSEFHKIFEVIELIVRA